MKKILLSLAILLSAQVMKADGPISWRAGIMALPHNMWMLSSGFVSTEGTVKSTYTPQFTFNTNLGLVAGVNFTDMIGVEINVILGKHKQKFNYEAKDEISGTTLADEDFSVEITKTDIPVLFKMGGLMYFEVGPQFTMINKVESVFDGDSEDISDAFTTSQMFVVLGTGAGIDVPKIARIEAGLRLGYGFQDINAHDKVMQIFDDKSVVQAFWGLKIAAIHKF